MLLRMKDDYDGAEPSPNTIAVLNLLRLAHLFGEPEWRKRADQTLAALAAQMRKAPLATPMGLVALNISLSAAQQIVIVGPSGQQETRQMLTAIWKRFLPGTVWAVIGSQEDRNFFLIGRNFTKA